MKVHRTGGGTALFNRNPQREPHVVWSDPRRRHRILGACVSSLGGQFGPNETITPEYNDFEGEGGRGRPSAALDQSVCSINPLDVAPVSRMSAALGPGGLLRTNRTDVSRRYSCPKDSQRHYEVRVCIRVDTCTNFIQQ